MRTRRLGALVVTALLALTGCGGASLMQPVPYVTALSPGKAMVKIHRPSLMRPIFDFGIWDRGQFVGISSAKTTIVYECDAGDHLFIAVGENVSIVMAQLEAGRTYDLVAEVNVGVPKPRVNLVAASTHASYRKKVESYDATLRAVVRDPYASQEYVQTHVERISSIAKEFDQGVWRGRFSQMGPFDNR